MGGIGDGSVDQYDLRIEQNARLLRDAFARYRCSDLPDRAKQIGPELSRSAQQRATAYQQIQ